MDKEEYRCFLYRQVDGKTQSHIFVGQTAVDEAIKDGWHTTFADFVDDAKDVSAERKEAMKDVCSIAAGDANILANADKINDIDKLRDAYERMTGNSINERVKTINGVRNVIRKALGDMNGD